MSVLLFAKTSPYQAHAIWAEQWRKADPINRTTVPIAGTGSHEKIRDDIVHAVQLAGNTSGNELIIAVGHGGATSPAAGTVDLAPQHKMLLTRGVIGSPAVIPGWGPAAIFYDPFYDFRLNPPLPSDKENDEDPKMYGNTPPAKFRLGRYALYQSIGAAIQANGIYKVTFLTCNVGNASAFIQKIAIDWQVLVKAYRRFVIFEPKIVDGKVVKVRVFLEGDPPEDRPPWKGSNTPAGEVNLPQIDFITVGPPLPPAPPLPPPIVPAPKKAEAPVIEPGPGRFRSAKIVGIGQPGEGLPHSLSRSARTLDPRERYQEFSSRRILRRG